MSDFDFTKRKFLTFPLEQRHKKCSELLRAAYGKMANGENVGKDLETYALLIEWMGGKPAPCTSVKEIADLYHIHTQSGNVHHKEHHLLPSVRSGDKPTGAPAWDIAVYLDNIRSAHNVGSILRTVEAFSLGKVYFSKQTPYATHKQVQDAAMGAAEWVECHQITSIETLPRPIIVLETSDHAVPLHDFPFPDTFTLVIGNEEYGCSDQILKNADALIEIPLRGRKNSLNVANAFAIASSEIARQKSRNHSP